MIRTFLILLIFFIISSKEAVFAQGSTDNDSPGIFFQLSGGVAAFNTPVEDSLEDKPRLDQKVKNKKVQVTEFAIIPALGDYRIGISVRRYKSFNLLVNLASHYDDSLLLQEQMVFTTNFIPKINLTLLYL